MDQVYWISTPLVEGTDTRTLLYRYGRFCYAGPVITEPLSGLEGLPAVLQGIQAVQGKIPYMCERTEMRADNPHRRTLAGLEAAIEVIHAEVTAAEPRLAELAAAPGNAWLEDDDAAVYFEFEARPGFTLNVRKGKGLPVEQAMTMPPLALHRAPTRALPRATVAMCS